MLMRIAISDGTYDSWLDATYTHERSKSINSPMYIGGLSKEMAFQEVINQTASQEAPLGQMGGRGTMPKAHCNNLSLRVSFIALNTDRKSTRLNSSHRL